MIICSKKRKVIFIAILLVILFTTMTVVLGKYVHTSSPLEAKYTISSYNTPTIKDEVAKDEQNRFYKDDLTVSVSDCGYPVYVRVALIVTWQKDGNVYGQQPVEGTGKDYLITYNTDDWFLGADGYYYCKNPVPSGGTTPALMKKDEQAIKQIGDAPDEGYTMHVEVAAETIQAVGSTDSNTKAVMDAWGMDPET